LKLLRRRSPDPQQLALQLDLFATEPAPAPLAAAPLPAVDNDSPDDAGVTPGGSPPMPPVPGMRRLCVGQQQLDYVLLRSKRRSIGFVIDDDGLRVTAPRWVGLAEIEQAIRDKQRWIFTKLAERRERSARRLQPQMQWRDGASLPFLGGELTLRLHAAQHGALHYDSAARELCVSLPPDANQQQLKDRVQGWLQAQASEIFAARLPLYAEKLEVSYRSFALSSATTQWGSCSADGRIRLNWRLIHFSLPLIDYVIAHELSHLREMNHSPRFWATVQSIFPEFAAAKKALREGAPHTLPAF
jgi:predicted metal-dependent hydrolase